MGPVLSIALKDLRLLVRDRVSLFWVLAFPLVFALFFGSIFGGDSTTAAMPIIVVDEADTADSRALTERLADNDALEVETMTDLVAARRAVRRGESVAFLRITRDYGGSFSAFGGGADDEAALQVGVDPSRTAERSYLQGLITQSVFSGMTDLFSDRDAMRAEVQRSRRQIESATDLDAEQKASLITVMDALDGLSDATADVDMGSDQDGESSAFGAGLVQMVEVAPERMGKPRSAYEVTFPSAIVWGLIGCAIAFATTLVRERTNGTLLRLRVAPITRIQLLGGKALACFVAGLAVAAVLLCIGVVALGVRVANPIVLFVGLAGASACFTGVMLAMSVMGKTEAAVNGGAWVIIMPLAMIGGGMIPLIAMPEWMLTAANVSPFKWAIFAIEAGIWRDLSLAEIALPVAVLLGLAATLFGMGLGVYRRTIG